MIVAHASVVVTALVDDAGPGALAREVLLAEDVHAPELLAVEVLSAVRRQVLRGALDVARADAVIGDLLDLAVEQYPHLPLLRRAWQLRASVSAYDAVYVALAEALRCVLVTADARLASAPGPECDVRVLR